MHDSGTQHPHSTTQQTKSHFVFTKKEQIAISGISRTVHISIDSKQIHSFYISHIYCFWALHRAILLEEHSTSGCRKQTYHSNFIDKGI
jgi:predicted lipase